MRENTLAIAAGAVAVMVALAGLGFFAIRSVTGWDGDCVRYGPPVRLDRVPEDAPSASGGGASVLRLTLRHGPDGDPLAGGAVVVYHAAWDPPQDASVQEPSGADAPLAAAGYHDRPATPGVGTKLELRSDERGVVEARVPAGRVVGIVAGAPGHAPEWFPAVRAGGDGEARSAVLPLYRSSPTFTQEGVFPGPAALGAAQPVWVPHPFGSEASSGGYAARLVSADFEVRWSNGQSGGADLGLGLASDADAPDETYDDDRDANVGTRYQRVEVGDFQSTRFADGAGLYAGPVAGTGVVAPGGLAYTLTMSGAVRSAGEPRTECPGSGWGGGSGGGGISSGGGGGGGVPGPQSLAVLAAVAAVALLRSRRAR